MNVHMAKAEKSITGAKYSASEYWPIDKLKLWERNPRSIKGERFDELKTRLKRQGQIKPLLVTNDGTVIGGNMRLRAMRDLGITEVWVSVTDASTDKEIFDLALTDNEEFGYYEKEQVAELAIELGLDPIELKSYALSLGEPTTLDLVVDELGPEITEEDDEAPEIDEDNPPVSKLGEVYQLGPHRLMCGSATESADVEKLMEGKKADMVFTDPPYGMFLDTNYSTMHKANDMGKGGKDYDKVIGDNDDFDPEFINVPLTRFADAKEIFMWGADYYKDYIPNGGSWIVWDKRANESGMDLDKLLGAAFELCWSRKPHKRDIARVLWSGHHGMQKDDTKTRVHPTQKPVELILWFLSRWGKDITTVVDLFGGSGSTLIAADKTNRICYMMELDPKYVDVIRKRYWKYVAGDEEGWEEATPVVEVAHAIAA